MNPGRTEAGGFHLIAEGDDFARALLDATPDATLIVAGTGKIVYVNRHAAALFGYAPDDLLDRTIEDLVPVGVAAIHRAHRTRYQAEPTERAMGANTELWARRSDGSELPVEISLCPLQLGGEVFAVAAVRDITDRVASEDHLHRVVRTLDASDDAVFIFDADTLRFSFVNDGAVRLVGYSRDELMHMSPLSLNPYATEAEYRRLVGSLGRDDLACVADRATLLRKEGSEVQVEATLHSAPVGRDRNTWIIMLARDITARMAVEADLRLSQDALREAEQVMAVAEDRERIARDLHDTVIQRIFGEGLNLQVALLGADDVVRTRARIQTTIDGMDETIKDLRMAVFSLQGAGFAPGGLRGRLLAVIADTTGGLGFEPRLQFDGPIETIDLDIAEQLVPVLREALSNATKHANAHNVRVTVTVAQDVTLVVSDDGDGVPEQVLGGRGVSNMAARASDFGGAFTISASPTGGAVLTWCVPATRPLAVDRSV